MKTEKETALPQGITQEMIDKAKKEWPLEGAVKLADLPTDDHGNTMTVLVRRPCREVMGNYSKFSEKQPKKADDILVNACLLSHKEEVKANELIFMSAVDAIAQMIVIRPASLKNI